MQLAYGCIQLFTTYPIVGAASSLICQWPQTWALQQKHIQQCENVLCRSACRYPCTCMSRVVACRQRNRCDDWAESARKTQPQQGCAHPRLEDYILPQAVGGSCSTSLVPCIVTSTDLNDDFCLTTFFSPCQLHLGSRVRGL